MSIENTESSLSKEEFVAKSKENIINQLKLLMEEVEAGKIVSLVTLTYSKNPKPSTIPILNIFWETGIADKLAILGSVKILETTMTDSVMASNVL